MSGLLGRRAGIQVFAAFAAAYFCSALVRAITAEGDEFSGSHGRVFSLFCRRVRPDDAPSAR